MRILLNTILNIFGIILSLRVNSIIGSLAFSFVIYSVILATKKDLLLGFVYGVFFITFYAVYTESSFLLLPILTISLGILNLNKVAGNQSNILFFGLLFFSIKNLSSVTSINILSSLLYTTTETTVFYLLLFYKGFSQKRRLSFLNIF